MALGPGIFKEQYKDYSLEQLNNALDELKKYLVSDELKQARQEEISKGIDDNNCITNVESEIEAIESLIEEKENNVNENRFIRKTMIDENGMEYEAEEQFALPDFDQIKWLGKISEKLQMELGDLSSNSKRLDDVKATYYWSSSRGGTSLIVSDDGSYLGATSSVDFDRHLQEFKTGRRNGNFNNTSESNDKILKINCRSCNNGIVIDCSKLPTNVKTLDTMCPNCKSFIKYGNLNYVEEQKKEYSQEDYKTFFYRQMTDGEKQKLAELNCTEKISKLITPTYQIKYLNGVGYIFIGEGYLILEDGTEPTHYFTNIFTTREEAINEIETQYKKKFDNTGTNHKINDENKETEQHLNSAFDEDIKNINSMLKDVENMIFGENKNFTLAKDKLLDFVKGVSIFENDNETDYYNFDDVIQFVIYTRLNKTNKKVVWSSIPFLTAYSYLAYVYNEEKNYDEALNIIEKQMKIAPLNLSAYFEKCETYKMQKMWEQFKEETQNIYTKIYDAKDLAHLYRNLGFYYIEQNKLDLAYALYTASIQFEKHRLAYSEMMYINQQLGRENYSMSAEETLKLLDDNNIPFGVKRENVDLLISIYENEKELIKNPNTEMLLASKIYYLSKDSRFAPYYEQVDKTTGCSIIIPRSWKPIKQEVIEKEFSKNQMFAIYTDTNALFQGVYDGKCPIDEFDKAYNLNVENMKKANMNLLYESELDLKLQKGVKKFKCALFETNGIRIYNCFTLINDIFVNFSINVSSEVDFNDSSKFNNQKNMVDLINVLSSILELNKDEIPGIQKDIKSDKVGSVSNIKENNNNELIEHTINSNINFKFKLPKLYGETTKKTDISFKIGNSINIMISKCSDVSKLDERSLQWLENSAKTNNQNILKDKVRKYFLNNDTIQVIERMVEKDDQRRMYKFVYLNESMIIFAFGAKGYNEKFENTINNAIISIKEIGNQEKIERDPFEKVNDNKKISNSKFETLLNIDKDDLKRILKLATNNQSIFFDNDKRLLSKNEMISYKEDLNISIDNIIPLIDLYDNNFLIYNVDKNIFQLMDISSEESYKDLNSIVEYIENIEKSMGKLIPKCPNCAGRLTFLMPDGQTLYCNKCGKYYKNENGNVGGETSSPYTRTDVLY